MKKNIIIIFGLALLGLTSACSLEPTLADRDDTSIATVAKLRQTMDGSYAHMVDFRFFGRNTIIAGEARSDNMYSTGISNRFVFMSSMDLQPTHADVDETFKYGYRGISNANTIINSDYEAIEGNEANKQHVIGEAYIVRALLHFELLKLFGQQYVSGGSNLGITYTKEFKGDDLSLPRGTAESNKADIFADIQDGLIHFSQAGGSSYSDSQLRITEDAANALKSRVGIYFKDYAKALEGSSAIVDDYPITPKDDVVEYWKSTEPGDASIFELFRSPIESASINGITNIYRAGSYGDVVAFPNILSDADFEATDVRADSLMINVEWVADEHGNLATDGHIRNMGKYPSIGGSLGADNIKMFRIEEVVLNHAEALLDQGGDALGYLNKITAARGASAYSTATIENILKERRKELMFEGFRFHDLARHGLPITQPDPTALNGHGLVPAGDNKFAMPIPRSEIDANRESVQNPGY